MTILTYRTSHISPQHFTMNFIYMGILIISGLVALDLVQTLECPACRRAEDCFNRTQTCHPDQDICMGTLLEWHFHMSCSYSHFCAHKQHLPGTTDCLRNGPYGPHEECYICCTGDNCNKDLQIVKQNFASIPNTLHCPSCDHASDPRDCLKNIIACPPLATECLISKDDGLYSSECNTRSYKCDEEHADPLDSCLPSRSGHCQSCCDHTNCLKEALHLPTVSTKPFTVPAKCIDDPTFPCGTAGPVVCSDPDFSVKTCPLTCGHCGGGQTSQGTDAILPPVTVKADCKDDPGFPCTSTLCSDPDFATLTCPATCGHCSADFPKTACGDGPCS